MGGGTTFLKTFCGDFFFCIIRVDGLAMLFHAVVDAVRLNGVCRRSKSLIEFVAAASRDRYKAAFLSHPSMGAQKCTNKPPPSIWSIRLSFWFRLENQLPFSLVVVWFYVAKCERWWNGSRLLNFQTAVVRANRRSNML